MALLDVIRQFYPEALTGNGFIGQIFRILQTEYALLPHQILLAHSICSDDANSIAYPEEGRKMLGPFNLGGLDGFPFTGLTGMGAFSHHIPDNGAGLVFFAPHIGIGAAGVPGQMLRVGQQAPSSCCGALIKAIQSLQQGTIVPGTPAVEDYQQQTLEQIILKSEKRIAAAANQILEGTEVIYEASEQFMDQLVQKTAFTGKYIFVIGAIIINSDWEQGSFLELRKFHCLDAPTKKLIATHSFPQVAPPVNR
jgi:hypothetical protein